MYNDASSTQPNYTASLGPDMEATDDQVTNGYESIKCMTKPQTKLGNHTPKTQINFDNPKQLDNPVYDEASPAQHKANAQTTSANLTQVRDEASEKGDHFYDAEEHTYSVVNKPKKKAKKKLSEDNEGEREGKY